MTKSIQKGTRPGSLFTNYRIGYHPNSLYVPPFRWTLLSLRGCHRKPNPWGEQVRLSLSHSLSATRRSKLYIWLIYLGRVHRRHGALLKNPARAEYQCAHAHVTHAHVSVLNSSELTGMSFNSITEWEKARRNVSKCLFLHQLFP